MKRLLTAVMLVMAPAPLMAQGLHYEGSLGLSRGSYIFADPITTWSLHTGLALSTGRVTLRASLPLILQNSTLLTGSGMGGVPSGGSNSGVVADSGQQRGGGGMSMALAGGPVMVPSSAYTQYNLALGDPQLHASVRLLQGRTGLGISAMAKAPVADTATYGTGQWDAGAGISLSHILGTTTLIGADLSWWHLGDLPDLNFRDPVQGSLSVAFLRPGGWGASFSLSASTRVLEGYDPPVSAAVSLLRTGQPSWFLTASAGFTETAPDFSLSLGWRARLLGPR